MNINKKLDMSFLIGVFKKYFPAVILSGIFCGLECFALLSFTTPKLYESNALIYAENAGQSEETSQYLADACRVIFKNTETLESLIASLDLPYTKEQLGGMMTAEPTADNGVIEISVRSGNAEDSMLIVDELADLAVQEFNRAMTFGEADVLSYGDVNTDPLFRSNVALFTAAGVLVGLVVSYIIAAVHARMDMIVRSDDDISQLYGFPILTEISEFNRVKNGVRHVSYMYDDMYDDDDNDNGISEHILSDNSPEVLFREYDLVKKAIISSIPENTRKIIAVTSSRDSEGKSTVSSNLAICFAEAGFKVLLIECDMVNPTISEKFGIKPEFGLSSVLEGECSVSDAINEGVVENLDIIAAGNIPSDSTELIGSPFMKTFLEASTESYNYVFLDTPPVSTSEDSQLMNETIAGFIFVIRENSTTHPDVKSAMEKIDLAKGKILGVVKTFSYA